MESASVPMFGIAQYIQRMHGLALTGQETVSELTTLCRDLISFLSLLQQNLIQPVLSQLVELWQKHCNVLLPIIGSGSKAFARIFTDEAVKTKIFDVLSQVVTSLPTLIIIVSAGFLCYQFYEWYEIYQVVSKINRDCEQIEHIMSQLRDGVNELRNLLFRLGGEITDADETLLVSQIDQKLRLMRIHYQPTLNLIESVRNEILANECRLEESRKLNAKNAIVSGVTGALSLGLLTVNPISTTVGLINAFAGAAICGTSVYLSSSAAKTLQDFSQKRLALEQYEAELESLKTDYLNFEAQKILIISNRVARQIFQG